MGLILNNNVQETKICSAYGLTVYGKINKYEWTIRERSSENALITIRIADSDGNDIFNMYMGNNAILQCRIDDTMDNFLYWIANGKLDIYAIEKQVYNSLCKSDNIFNQRIINEKLKEKKRIAEEKQMEERRENERIKIGKIAEYCKEKGYFYYNDYGNIIILKANTNDNRKILAEVQKSENMDKMRSYIEILRKYPDYKGIEIVKEDLLENIEV